MKYPATAYCAGITTSKVSGFIYPIPNISLVVYGIKGTLLAGDTCISELVHDKNITTTPKKNANIHFI